MVDQLELSQRAPWSVSVRPRTVFRAYDTADKAGIGQYIALVHLLDLLQPAARASSSEQNHRSPFPALILVRL